MYDNMSQTTHPIRASLDHPLFACGGKRDLKNNKISHPLSSKAEERVGEQSDAGVSRSSDMLKYIAL